MKTLPNWLLAGSRNQLPKRLLASTVIDEADGARFWPDAGLNAKPAWVTSRAVEKPVTTMLIVLPLRFTCTLLMTGAARATWAVIVGAGLGVMSMPPAWSRSVMLIVPETVPVWIASGSLAVGLPTGISKAAVVSAGVKLIIPPSVPA